MERSQKEYYLNEQMQAIQKELGEGDDQTREIEELRTKLEAAGLPENVVPLPRIKVDDPAISMTIGTNTSPLAGKVRGSKVTARLVKDRLDRELIGNVSLRVLPTERPDAWEVQGRGELALAILVALAAGAFMGFVYATLLNRFGMPSFVSTLSGLLAMLGLQLYLLGSTGSINLPYASPLVKFGQNLALAIAGRGEGRGWLPYLLLWAGLVGGAIAGATLYPLAAGLSLWVAAGAAALLAVPAWRLGPVAV